MSLIDNQIFPIVFHEMSAVVDNDAVRCDDHWHRSVWFHSVLFIELLSHNRPFVWCTMIDGGKQLQIFHVFQSGTSIGEGRGA